MTKQFKQRDKKEQPPRFPRLVRGQGAAALEKLLWVPPTFEVRLKKTKRGAVTRLIFTLAMPADFVKSYPELYWFICGPWAGGWENAIADGYWKSRYGDRTLPKFIQKVLRWAFKNGVRIFLKETWNLPDEFYKEQVVEELSAFDEHTLSRPGPGPNAQIAFWAAKRFSDLIQGIRALRYKFKGPIPHNRSQELQAEIEKLCSYETYVKALERLLGEGKITPWDIRSKKTHPRAIALAIIEYELPKYRYKLDLKQGSLWKHIQLGKELLELFAFEQKSPAPRSA